MGRHIMSVIRRFNGSWCLGGCDHSPPCTGWLLVSLNAAIPPDTVLWVVIMAQINTAHRGGAGVRTTDMSVGSLEEHQLSNRRPVHSQGPTRCHMGPIKHRVRAYNRHT
jgi:hypothetical protein